MAAFERAQALYREALPPGVSEETPSAGWPPYLVRQAFMHEHMGEYDEAAELYRQAIKAMQKPTGATDVYGGSAVIYVHDEDYYQAAKHLGDMLLRRARSFEAAQGDGEGAANVRARYAEAAGAYRDALEVAYTRGYTGSAIQANSAANNLGIALIKAHEYEEAIEVLKPLVEPSSDPPKSWDVPPISDQNSPVFHLNLGSTVPPDWEFAAHAERSSFVVSLGAVLLLLWGIVRRVASQKSRETFIGKVSELLRIRYDTRASRLLPLEGFGTDRSALGTRTFRA